MTGFVHMPGVDFSKDEWAQKVYVRDVEKWIAKGWRPTRNAAGQIVCHPSMTGDQCWVTRPALAGLKLETPIDWID